MDANQLICFLLRASKLLIICPIVIFAVSWLWRRFRKNHELVHIGLNRRLVIFAACMMLSIWCLRFSVGYYDIVAGITEAEEKLTAIEEIFNSIVHTFQSFSMDEEYTAYITNGRAMIAEIFPGESDVEKLYGIYAAVLNCAAPIAGGAIIFEIIASIFPTILLRLSYLAVWREKYYFSELNENVLAFIKSLNKEHARKLFSRPTVIITDSYVDKENERSSELALKAKLLGAICVKNDIVHIPKNYIGKRKIILADENENNNLFALVSLSSALKKGIFSYTEIFYLSQKDMPFSVSKQVRENLEKTFKENITFLPVNVHRNIITKLLVDIPLFEPVVGMRKVAVAGDSSESDSANAEASKPVEKRSELNLTIIGSGQIGTEMLLAAYSLGQMLDCRLNITVYSKEKKSDFKQRINYINTEIFRTMDIADPELHIPTEDDPLLLKYPKGKEKAPAYCSLSYIEIDVKSEEFFSMISVDKVITQNNYFFVALGSDDENVLMANTLKDYLGRKCLLEGGGSKTVITYVVFNSKLQMLLNVKKLYSYSKNKNDIYMKAVGSREDIYSVDNILMQKMKPLIESVSNSYNSKSAVEERKKQSADIKKDEYNFFANMARAAHIKYKMFSSGVWTSSLFDEPNETDYEKKCEEFKRTYRNMLRQYEEYSCEMARLAWLEHRRWNAFMRTRGFIAPENTASFIESEKSQKNIELKLHACIVECDEFGIKVKKVENSNQNTFPMINTELSDVQFEALKPDKLDSVSRKVAMCKSGSYDFKKYDYPVIDIE